MGLQLGPTRPKYISLLVLILRGEDGSRTSREWYDSKHYSAQLTRGITAYHHSWWIAGPRQHHCITPLFFYLQSPFYNNNMLPTTAHVKILSWQVNSVRLSISLSNGMQCRWKLFMFFLEFGSSACRHVDLHHGLYDDEDSQKISACLLRL